MTQALAVVNKESQELQRREPSDPLNLEEIMLLGDVFAKSGFFADSKDAAKCVVKILAGRELGISPIASMRGIHIINSNTSLAANLMAAAIKKSGLYTYKVRAITNEKVEIEFFERSNSGWQSCGMSSFSFEDAKAAGALDGSNKHNWTKYRRNMMFARAMSNGARWYCADVFGGAVYVPEELGAGFDTTTGEYIPTNQTIELQEIPSVQPSEPGTPVQKSREEMTPREKAIADIRESLNLLRVLGDQMFIAETAEDRQAQVIQAVQAYAMEFNLDYKTLQAVKELNDKDLDGFAGWLEGRVQELQEKAIDATDGDDPIC